MPPISNLFAPVSSVQNACLRPESFLSAVREPNAIRKSDFETVSVIALLAASAGAIVSRFWSRKSSVASPGARIAVNDPYRTPGEVGAVRAEPGIEMQSFTFEISAIHGRMAFESVTLSSRVRLDTKLEFEKKDGSWWVTRGDFGRCRVQIATSAGHYEAIMPNVHYPVRSAETLKIDDEYFALTIASDGAVPPGPPPSAPNRHALDILRGDWAAIRRAGACVGMVERASVRGSSPGRVGIPSAVFLYLHRTTGRILAMAHNGRHPRPEAGIPIEIRAAAFPVRLDLMADEGAGEEDGRVIARYQTQGEIPDGLKTVLDAMPGRVFRPLAEAIDARRAPLAP